MDKKTKENIMAWSFFMSGIFLTSLFAIGVNAEQTGNCTAGTQYCEQNSLNTTNTTTTSNTNQNTNNTITSNTSVNTNVSTNQNTNVSTNQNTNVITNNTTTSNTSVNTNVSTNQNTNINQSTSISNSTVNSTVNQNVNNTNNSTSNSTSSNTNQNTNINQSTSESNVQTNNVNQNNNNTKSDNTNRNINESNSTQTINQNVKSEAPPASAIAPSIMSYSQDLCTVGRSGAFQGQVFGFSGGKTVRDENCERLKLSKYLYDMGMKVASISLLCADERVFKAMEQAGTPCPYKGKIGKEATVAWEENKIDRPDYKVWYKEKAQRCKQMWHSNSQLKKECIAGLK